ACGGSGRGHFVARFVGIPDRRGAQELVPLDHVVQRALQRLDIDRAGSPPAVHQGVAVPERAVPVTLVEGAQELLVQGERNRACQVLRRERRLGNTHGAQASLGLRGPCRGASPVTRSGVRQI